MRHIIQFHVYKGEKQYVASGADLPIVTQADTLDQLVQNLKEAVALHLQGENLAELGLAEKPHILLNMEVTDSVYA